MADVLFPPAVTKTATLSDCGKYRYSLGRFWGEGSRSIAWVMLNPSTADATADDPTIRRCVAFSRAWGFDALTVYNLYCLRATNPAELWRHPDPVGPEADAHLRLASRFHLRVVCAWGANARADRVRRAIEILTETGRELHCLGLTKDGQPRHPLYVAGNTPLVSFPVIRAALEWRTP